MDISSTYLQQITSQSELESLIELTGVDGVNQVIQNIQHSISEGLERVFSILDTAAADGKRIVPELVEPAIQVGKMLRLLQLVEEAAATVSTSRVPYLRGAWDLLQQERPESGSPDQLDISPALGIQQERSVVEDWGTDERREQLLTAFTNLLPLLGRLQTSRYFFNSPSGNSGIATHQNSLELFGSVVAELVGPGGAVDLREIKRAVFGSLEYLQPNYLSLLVLVNAFFKQLGYGGEELPYNLVRFSNCLLGTRTVLPATTTLDQEINSKRIHKLIKDFDKLEKIHRAEYEK